MAFGNNKWVLVSTAEDEDGHSIKLTTYPNQWTLRAYVHLNVTPHTFKCQNIIMWAYLGKSFFSVMLNVQNINYRDIIMNYFHDLHKHNTRRRDRVSSSGSPRDFLEHPDSL
jgi:hypothetical protein